MGGVKQTPPPPRPKVARMPLVDDPNKEAARANREAVLSQRGRRSTMLSELTQGRAGSTGSQLGGGTS